MKRRRLIMTSKTSIEVFSTCPYSSAVERERFPPNVVDVARWSEQAGCRGILVYTDNSTVDPWLVSQIIIQSTEALCPLVAVQPVYMHPYSGRCAVRINGQWRRPSWRFIRTAHLPEYGGRGL